jgi:hypothetical protein
MTGAERHGGGSLTIQVDKERLAAAAGQPRGHVDGGGRFAYPSLVVDNRNCLEHRDVGAEMEMSI